MKLRDNKSFLLFYLFIAISIFGCNKNHLSITFKNVFIQKYKYPVDEETILFYLQIVNGTDKDIDLNKKSNGGTLEDSGFFLISNEFYSEAVKLKVSGGDEGKKIKNGQSTNLLLFLSVDKLRSILKKYCDEKYSNQDIVDFLTRGNYSLVYISFNEPGTQNVLKSSSFKTVEIHSPDTIQKLLTP
ncbi:hypothetical protein [Mucilaginibacter flavidus]|uniref:hypothetical protein n=1 Tax=Mucilaginibacter flavidus TaxID=2949309 RepID=UPI002093841A|nr:hypothetical protein [Mucilaginibacter flavidus]MCO5951210.1 hypothetical protein [Mucilaginibacter flavidus]